MLHAGESHGGLPGDGESRRSAARQGGRPTMKKAVAGFGMAAVMAMAQIPPPPATGMEAPKAAEAGQTTPPAPARKAAAPVSKAAAPKPAAAAASYKDLKYPPVKPIVTPPMEPLTLANGMRVFVVEDHDAALINGMAVVRTGNLFDPKDRVGLATLTGQAMRTGGTRTRTAEQLTLLLENMAATLDSGIGERSGAGFVFGAAGGGGAGLARPRVV